MAPDSPISGCPARKSDLKVVAGRVDAFQAHADATAADDDTTHPFNASTDNNATGTCTASATSTTTVADAYATAIAAGNDANAVTPMPWAPPPLQPALQNPTDS